jgi:hypothetical protein
VIQGKYFGQKIDDIQLYAHFLKAYLFVGVRVSLLPQGIPRWASKFPTVLSQVLLLAHAILRSYD